MLKAGTRNLAGLDEAVYQNIEACNELAHITRTSLGPNGLFKMILNHLEKLIVTKNASTIATELEVKHPAAKMLVMAANNQAIEYGDGTNLVITLAGELLNQASSLLQQGVVVADVIAGYDAAFERIQRVLAEPENVLTPVTNVRDPKELAKVLRTALASKQYGYEDALAPIVAEACTMIMDEKGNFNPDSVRVAKVLGRSVEDSFVVRGFVIPALPKGTVDRMEKCVIAVYACEVQNEETETKGTVLLESAEELVSLSASAEHRMKEKIKALKAAGVNVIVAQMNINDLAIHYCNKYGILCIKVGSKYEIRRFAKSVNAQLLMTFRVPEPARCGHCDLMQLQEIGDKKVVICRDEAPPTGERDSADLDARSAAALANGDDGAPSPRASCRDISTIVIRAATQNVADDVAVAVGNAVNVAKATVGDGRFVPGAGACEMHLATALRTLASTTTGLEQYSIRAFADALEIVPRILAETSGLHADTVLSQLQASHVAGDLRRGVNVEGGSALAAPASAGSSDSGKDFCLDAVEAGILDNLAVKSWAIRMAVDAACSVLRVDQVVMRKQAGGPAPRQAGQAEWN